MREYLMQYLGEPSRPPRFKVSFVVEGDISLMMHILLTELGDHIKIIGGADGVSIKQINQYIGEKSERGTDRII